MRGKVLGLAYLCALLGGLFLTAHLLNAQTARDLADTKAWSHAVDTRTIAEQRTQVAELQERVTTLAAEADRLHTELAYATTRVTQVQAAHDADAAIWDRALRLLNAHACSAGTAR